MCPAQFAPVQYVLIIQNMLKHKDMLFKEQLCKTFVDGYVISGILSSHKHAFVAKVKDEYYKMNWSYVLVIWLISIFFCPYERSNLIYNICMKQKNVQLYHVLWQGWISDLLYVKCKTFWEQSWNNSGICLI